MNITYMPRKVCTPHQIVYDVLYGEIKHFEVWLCESNKKWIVKQLEGSEKEFSNPLDAIQYIENSARAHFARAEGKIQ